MIAIFSESNLPSISIWLGATDAATQGTFRWTATNAVMTYTDWHPGQPSDLVGDEDCVQLSIAARKWNDILCEATCNSVCEIEY